MMVGVKKKLMWRITVATLLSSMVFDSIYINKYVKLLEEQEQYKIQIQEHEQEAKQLTEEINGKSEMIESLQQQIHQLEAENQSLEGVRSIIISNVGYFPNVYERDLLERLVECEAGGESLEGKIAVVNVVLNRIKSNNFPDSITAVVYQKNQFEPVVTGVIDIKTPSAESKEAVKRAFLGERVIDEGILYFWASWLDLGNDLWNHVDIVQTIGVHHFGRSWD